MGKINNGPVRFCEKSIGDSFFDQAVDSILVQSHAPGGQKSLPKRLIPFT